MPFAYECAGCGIPIVKEVSNLKRAFCTRECYHRSTIKYPDRECPQCGKTFSPRTGSRHEPGARKGRPDRTYCSWECYNADRANPPVTKTCPVCGKDFTVKACIAHRYNVCSEACKTADTIYVDCGRCGTRFRAEKHLNRRYCSEECRRPPMFLACRNCGQRFREVPSAAHRQFCSLACYRGFVGETGLEARVRVALEGLGVEFRQEYGVGRWSIDFALPGQMIAIEADGTYWHSITAERDVRRDAELKRAGWRVVRLPELDVTSAPDVASLIRDRVRNATGIDLADLASPAHPRPVVVRQLTLWDDDAA